jgi:hypothetical protein
MHSKEARRANEHRRVSIMAACVHRPVYLRSEIETRRFPDLERVHIGPE